MISAQTTAQSSGPAWGYSYSYDGFGNLLAKNVTKGSPSAGWSEGGSAGNNRAFSSTYDGNGNILSDVLLGAMTYDVENRLTSLNNNGTDYWIRSVEQADSEAVYGRQR